MTWQNRLESLLRQGLDFDLAVREAQKKAFLENNRLNHRTYFENDLLNLRRTEKNRIKNAVKAGYSLQQAFQAGIDDRYTANLYQRYF